MDSKTNGEQPAFGDSTTHAHQHGLTKREHFAAMAMQGRLAYVMDTNQFFQHGRMEEVARMSVEMADALLRALAAGGEGC